MKKIFQDISEMRFYLLLWFTQMISGLGSAMTGYALVIWSYTQQGSALATALLMVCSYTPYVICSIFAGALSDRWDKKKTMLGCDAMAALCTVTVLVLLKTGLLRVWHLYLCNAVSGLMNTVQQPASEVATTAASPEILPEGGWTAVFQQFPSIHPDADSGYGGDGPVGPGRSDRDGSGKLRGGVHRAAALHSHPKDGRGRQKENLLKSAAEGIRWLRSHAGIFHLMLFLAAINLVASMYDAAFPAMMLSKPEAGRQTMGIVSGVTGAATLLGSVLASFLKPPKNRVRAIWGCLMLSMCTENFFLAFGNNVTIWCFGAFLGWIGIPWMNANLDVINRLHIPVEMQGRVFAARNSFQFFTIPVGYFLGGLLVDRVFEPFLASRSGDSLLVRCFGSGKGSGAACLFAVLWLMGIGVCLLFRNDRQIWKLEK